MPEEVRALLDLVIRWLVIAGATALILGFLMATLHGVLGCRREGLEAAIARYRQALGRVVLIGLEVLAAATIIKTITLEPTLQNAGFLAITIVIRTALGWTTVLEASGHWPWQKAPEPEQT
jgi:uncharacterized membrane protein